MKLAIQLIGMILILAIAIVILIVALVFLMSKVEHRHLKKFPTSRRVDRLS